MFALLIAHVALTTSDWPLPQRECPLQALRLDSDERLFHAKGTLIGAPRGSRVLKEVQLNSRDGVMGRPPLAKSTHTKATEEGRDNLQCGNI